MLRRTYHTYFARCEADGLIKVGETSRGPARRMVSLRSERRAPCTLLASCPSLDGAERSFHVLLAEHHSHGEWFHPTPQVMAVVAAVADGVFDFGSLPDWRTRIVQKIGKGNFTRGADRRGGGRPSRGRGRKVPTVQPTDQAVTQ